MRANPSSATPTRPFKRPACNSCRVAHVACEKCNLLGKGELCQDANVKKRGRPRKTATSSSAAPGTPKGNGPSPATAEEEAPCSKRARPSTGVQEAKPLLPAVLPRLTTSTATAKSLTSTTPSSTGSGTESSSGQPSSIGTCATSPDKPRLPPPSSLLRLGQQSDFPLNGGTSLPPLSPTALLYPSFIISLFQNAAGISPLAPNSSQSGNTPQSRNAAQTQTATTAPLDARNGVTEANLMMILDSIKEIRETNEQLRKEMTEIKNENAQLQKEKEELRAKLEEHLDLQHPQP